MAVKYDVIAGGEKYVGTDGKERRKNIHCGVVMENKYGGLSIKIESLPINFDGWLNTREPKPKEVAQNTGNPPANFDDMESDVPF
jgi:hypothetical protein